MSAPFAGAAARPSRAKGDPPRRGGGSALSGASRGASRRRLWRGKRGKVDPKQSRRDRWRPGWDRAEQVVGPLDGGAYRDGGRSQGWTHRQAAAELATQVEVMRQAAYIQRAGAAVGERTEERQCGLKPDGRRNRYTVRYYDDDPEAHARPYTRFAGRAVVDAARLADRLAQCSQTWRHRLTLTDAGRLGVVPTPQRCGLTLWCPHCAQVAAVQRAHATRAALQAAHETGEVGAAVLVTLTQRSDPQEAAEGARARLRAAYRRWGPGKHAPRSLRAWWDASVWGTRWAEEVTDGSDGRRYHWHRHVLVLLRPGVDLEEAARRLGERWQAVTEDERPGWGWDPWAGGVRTETGRWGVGGWWRPIDLEDTALGEVFQATKYLIKPGSLDAFRWLQVATTCRGRARGTTGGLRGLQVEQDQAGAELVGPPPGEPVCPLLDCPKVDDDGGAVVAWPVPLDLLPRVRAALQAEEQDHVAGWVAHSYVGETPDVPGAEPVPILGATPIPKGGPLPWLIEDADGWRLAACRSWARLRGQAYTAEVAAALAEEAAARMADADHIPEGSPHREARLRRAALALSWCAQRSVTHRQAVAVLAEDWRADRRPPHLGAHPDDGEGIPY